MNPSLAVAVLNYNGWKETRGCLESIEASSTQEFLLIIVDNGSTDDSVERLREWFRAPGRRKIKEFHAEEESYADGEESGTEPAKRAWLVRVEKNQGYAGGANVALDRVLMAGAERGLFVSNDVRLGADAICLLQSEMDRHKADFLGPVVLNEAGSEVLFDGRSWPGLLFGRGRLPESTRVGECWSTAYVEGSAFLVKRALLEVSRRERGFYFDPSFFMYGEDVDFGLWASRAGFRLKTTNVVKIRHGHAKSHGGGANPFSHHYITRNRVFLARRWLRFPQRLLFHAYYVPSRLLLILFRLGRGKLGSWFGVKAGLRGLLNGYAGVSGRWVLDE